MILMTPSEPFLIKINPVWYFTFLIKTKKKTLKRNNKTKHYSCRIANKLIIIFTESKRISKALPASPLTARKTPFLYTSSTSFLGVLAFMMGMRSSVGDWNLWTGTLCLFNGVLGSTSTDFLLCQNSNYC